jgi:tetratricopeptide (TPR) repeat protein
MIGKSQEALDYRLEAWEIQKLYESVDYQSSVRLLDEIGFKYGLMGRMHDSLQFYTKALDIREKTLLKNSFNLSYSFNNLAYLYEAMKDMASAMKYHRKALDIYESYYPDDHWLCERSRRSIQRVMQ